MKKKAKTSLDLLIEYLENTPKDELAKMIDEVDAMKLPGPTLDEYKEILKKMKII